MNWHAITKSVVEDAAHAWLEGVGWQVADRPAVAPATPAAQRPDESHGAIERAISELRELGRLERVGPAKGGSWKVLE